MTRAVWTNRGAHQETGAQTVWTNYGAHQETSGATGESFALAATEASDTAAFTATVTENFTLAATEASDTAAFTVNTGENFALSATEAADTFAGTLNVGENFALAAMEDPDTYAGIVTVTAGDTDTFILDATEAPDTFAGTMTVTESFALDATEAPDTYAGSMTVNTTTTFVMSATEAPDNALIFVDVPLGEVDLDTGRKRKPVINVKSGWEPIYDRDGRRIDGTSVRSDDALSGPDSGIDEHGISAEVLERVSERSAHYDRLLAEDEIILRLLQS